MARRTPAVLSAAALALAGCTGSGGGEAGQPPPAATLQGTIPGGIEPSPAPAETGAPAEAPPAPEDLLSPEAAALIRLFVDAAGSARPELVWDLLSRQTRQRFGPTFGEFSKGVATELAEGVGSFAGTGYGVVLAVEAPGGWAIAAVAGQRVAEGREQFASYAVALRPEGDTLRVELGGPVELTPLVPGSGVVDAGAEIAFAAEAPVAIERAALWVDGHPVRASAVGPDPLRLVVSGRPPEPLVPGPHVGIAFAGTGGEATALAWTFQVG